MRMLDDDESNDVEVTWQDQQRINQFSRLNARQTDTQNRLEALRTDKEQVDEVLEEVQLLEMTGDLDDEVGLSDDDDDEELEGDAGNKKAAKTTTTAGKMPFKVGDAFVYVTLERATELLEAEQKRLDKEADDAEASIRASEEEMKKLKVDLYAKFGSNINLERD